MVWFTKNIPNYWTDHSQDPINSTIVTLQTNLFILWEDGFPVIISFVRGRNDTSTWDLGHLPHLTQLLSNPPFGALGTWSACQPHLPTLNLCRLRMQLTSVLCSPCCGLHSSMLLQMPSILRPLAFWICVKISSHLKPYSGNTLLWLFYFPCVFCMCLHMYTLSFGLFLQIM